MYSKSSYYDIRQKSKLDSHQNVPMKILKLKFPTVHPYPSRCFQNHTRVRFVESEIVEAPSRCVNVENKCRQRDTHHN